MSWLLQIGVGDKLESVSAVEVQVDSSSLTAVCGLHHAVLQRLQVQKQHTHTHTHKTLSNGRHGM